jgi:hypothetical protein
MFFNLIQSLVMWGLNRQVSCGVSGHPRGHGVPIRAVD